jgi:hypothetical protein
MNLIVAIDAASLVVRRCGVRNLGGWATRRSLYLLVLFVGTLLSGRAGAGFIAFDDPARWGAAAQVFTTENFDAVTPQQPTNCGGVNLCPSETFVLTDFDIQTPAADVGPSIDSDGLRVHLHGVFRIVDAREGAGSFDIVFDRPISAIGLYLTGETRGPGGGTTNIIPPKGIDIFVEAPAFGEPFFKPDTDPFLGLVSDTAFSQIHFILHDVRAPNGLFLDRYEDAALSRVDYRFAVPEPATLALVAIAFAALGWARRAPLVCRVDQ